MPSSSRLNRLPLQLSEAIGLCGHPRKGAIRLTSSCRRNSAKGKWSKGPTTAIPALLTRPPSLDGPRIPLTFSAASFIEDSLVTSTTNGVNVDPNSDFKRSASVRVRTVPKISNPLRTRTSAMPQPMPVDVPVTTIGLVIIFFLLDDGQRSCSKSTPYIL